MAAITQNEFERAVRADWKRWGNGYSLFTTCSSCSAMAHCRGKLRAYVLCLDCFDERQS